MLEGRCFLQLVLIVFPSSHIAQPIKTSLSSATREAEERLGIKLDCLAYKGFKQGMPDY